MYLPAQSFKFIKKLIFYTGIRNIQNYLFPHHPPGGREQHDIIKLIDGRFVGVCVARVSFKVQIECDKNVAQSNDQKYIYIPIC